MHTLQKIHVGTFRVAEDGEYGCPSDGSHAQHNAALVERQSSAALQSPGGDHRPLRKYAQGQSRGQSRAHVFGLSRVVWSDCRLLSSSCAHCKISLFSGKEECV